MTTTVPSTEIVAGTWTIDPSHSEVGFTVRHLMTKVRGQFEKFEGKVTTGASLDEVSAEATIDLNSVNTRDAQRDGHLRSGDFFDVENNGPMTFRSTR
jgi:polyisoprenoid-binding protein YceI